MVQTLLTQFLATSVCGKLRQKSYDVNTVLLAQTVKNLPARQETWVEPWLRKIPWRREWLPTPVFLPGEVHGQRSLAAYSPWGHKESDTTEQLTHIKILRSDRRNFKARILPGIKKVIL